MTEAQLQQALVNSAAKMQKKLELAGVFLMALVNPVGASHTAVHHIVHWPSKGPVQLEEALKQALLSCQAQQAEENGKPN